MQNIKSEIHSYWTGRAEGYAEYNRKELEDDRHEKWRRALLEPIEAHFPGRPHGEIRVLDIGTGPGFFAILLSEMGFQVTAVDSTEEMLKLAGDNAGDLGDYIAWHVGDAQNLLLPDDTFDVIVSRNVTWNLPDPEAAYKEWLRVLKNGGIMLNFDANWYHYLFDKEKKTAFEADRENTRKQNMEDCNVGDDFDRCEDIAREVPLSKVMRPAWDLEVLEKYGFREISANEEIWKSVWSEDEKVSCASTPMFLIKAEKMSCKERIVDYWENRSDSFLKQRREELHAPIAARWMQELHRYIFTDHPLRILDVGCGAGYFSILLASEGHEVTGIDLTPSMIESARQLAAEEGINCVFKVMDAEKPDFADDTFDVVISRNLTWTLPDPQGAYRQWIRVLKKGGLLLNIDGNYGKDNSADTSSLPEKHAHHTLGNKVLLENEAIKRQLPITFHSRPAWDFEILSGIGIEEFRIDTGISKRIYINKDEFYNPTPLFALAAIKQ